MEKHARGPGVALWRRVSLLINFVTYCNVRYCVCVQEHSTFPSDRLLVVACRHTTMDTMLVILVSWALRTRTVTLCVLAHLGQIEVPSSYHNVFPCPPLRRLRETFMLLIQVIQPCRHWFACKQVVVYAIQIFALHTIKLLILLTFKFFLGFRDSKEKNLQRVPRMLLSEHQNKTNRYKLQTYLVFPQDDNVN